LWISRIFPNFSVKELRYNFTVILSKDSKKLTLPVQDLMLCGGSDAAIIPIGILFLLNFFGFDEVIILT
jgi:hypothetical protein